MLKNLVLIFLLTFGCSKQNVDDSWDVLTNGGVVKLNPEQALSNVGAYLLKQTHKTIFRYDKHINLKSDVLSTWSTSRDYKTLKLCVGKNQFFDKDRPFTVTQLVETLKKTLRKGHEHSVQIEKECATFSFETSAKYALYKLTLLYYAPTLATENKDVDLGLGPFKVSKLRPDHVVLVRKNKVKGGFNTINLYDFMSFDKNKMNASIEDFNRIDIKEIPDTIKRDYNSFNTSILKSAVILFNIEDTKLRESLYHCISLDKVREIIFDSKEEEIKLKTVTPVGIPGSEQGIPVQNCVATSNKKELIFANWKHDKKDLLQMYFDRLKTEHGINVKVVNFTFEELNDMVWKTKVGYDLVIPFLDPTQNAVGEAFSAFAHKTQKFYSFNTDYLYSDYEKLMNIENRKDIAKYVRSLNSKISENNLAIPLKQVSRKFYFPKRLRNFSIGSDLLEHPDIGNIKF